MGDGPRRGTPGQGCEPAPSAAAGAAPSVTARRALLSASEWSGPGRRGHCGWLRAGNEAEESSLQGEPSCTLSWEKSGPAGPPAAEHRTRALREHLPESPPLHASIPVYLLPRRPESTGRYSTEPSRLVSVEAEAPVRRRLLLELAAKLFLLKLAPSSQAAPAMQTVPLGPSPPMQRYHRSDVTAAAGDAPLAEQPWQRVSAQRQASRCRRRRRS